MSPADDEDDAFLDAFADKEARKKFFGADLENRLTGWPEDKWREEMEKHPFFTKQVPDISSGSLPPLIDGLAQLKYDPEHNEPADLAQNYKEDGNFYYKHKNYRVAIISYTEGIKINCSDDKINSILYNNRSMCHYLLENYRSSLRDCQKSISLDPDYRKAKVRAANCTFKLLEFHLCEKYCQEILSNRQDVEIEKLKRKAQEIIMVMKIKDDVKDQVMNAMKDKGIKFFDPNKEDDEAEHVTSSIPSLETPPHLAEYGYEIIWPITLLYPEKNVYDYYQKFPESAPLQRLLDEILSMSPDWDDQKRYKPDNVDVFYIGKTMKDLIKVNLKKSLLNIMKEKSFYLRSMSPTFLISLKQ